MPAVIEREAPRDRDHFRAGLLDFINHTLPELDRRPRQSWHVEPDTPLFETGLLDSLSILHLMAAVEQLTGQAVPPRLVVMKHFRAVNAIVDTFWRAEQP